MNMQSNSNKGPDLGRLPLMPFMDARPIVPLFVFCSVISLHEASAAIVIFTCILYAMGVFVLCLDRQDVRDRRYLLTLFGWGFLLRTFVAVFLYYWLIYSRGEPFLGGGDDEEYEIAGKVLHDLWLQGVYEIPQRMSHQPGYTVFSGVIRHVGGLLGGYHILLSRVVNAFIGALIAPYIFVLTRNIFDRRVAVFSGIIVLLFPLFVFYSSVQLRDIIIVFLFVLSMSQLSRFVVHGKSGGIIIAAACSLPMFYLRTVYGFGLLGAVGVSLLGCLIFQKTEARKYLWKKVVLLSLGIFLLFGYASFVGQSTLSYDKDSEIMQPLEEEHITEEVDLQKQHKLAAATEESLAARIVASVPGKVGFVVLPAVAFLMPYPPWKTLSDEGPLMYFFFFNAVSWTIMIPLCLLGFAKAVRKHFPENLLVIVPMLLVLVASGAGGFHTRYKLASLPFSLVFGAIGLLMLKDRRSKTAIEFYLMMQLGMAAAYFIVKML